MKKRGEIGNFALILLIAVGALTAAVMLANMAKPSITGFAPADGNGSDGKEDGNQTQADGENATAEQAPSNQTAEEEKGKPEKEDKKEPNVPPVWKSDIAEFTLNGKTAIDLGTYFSDSNNDTITYTSSTPDKIAVEISGSIATLTPAGHNFEAAITFTASDGDKSTGREVRLIIPERKITIDLGYKAGTIYNTPDDGIAPTTGIVDMTVENSRFTWNADPGNLCTRWETYSLGDEKATLVCYGSEKCCNFIDLEPARNAWNDPFYSSYGQYGASLDNIVSAQILYVDYKLAVDEPFSEIYFSSWQNLSVKYYFEFADFNNLCIDTCSLSGFNDSSYELIFEIDNAAITLESLAYTTVETIEKVQFGISVEDSSGSPYGSYALYKDGVVVTDEFVEPDFYDIVIQPLEGIFQSILVQNIQIDNVNVKKKYAVDLGDLDFEKATLTANATGNSLYKCRQWDYDTEVCFGTWERVQDLVPGEQYNVTLTADDPGFIEGDINITVPAAPPPTGLAFTANIPNVSVVINRNSTIDLPLYFSNLEAGTIFNHYPMDDILVEFDNNIAIVIPSKGFAGSQITFITANKSDALAVSNVFSVNVLNISIGVTPDLSINKSEFKSDEDVELEFEYVKKDELVRQSKWKEEYEVFERDTKKTRQEREDLKKKLVKGEKRKKKWETANEKIETTLLDNKGNAMKVEPEIEELREGKFRIKVAKPRSFKAGKYRLRVDFEKEGFIYSEEQEFTWGVLAINTHKSAYLPNEEAFIGIGVLNDFGRMVCDADVALEITNPGNKKTILSTANGRISISPECEIYGVTNLPDYYTTYDVSGVGSYLMNLTAVTPNGVRSIADSFIVLNNVDFDVSRRTATRIYPLVPYYVNITIIAGKDYKGAVNEYVPSSFAILTSNGAALSTAGDTTMLSWNVDLKKGNRYDVWYRYDAPDTSPEFYLLGPLDIGSFKEYRQWQIANDEPADAINITMDFSGPHVINHTMYVSGHINLTNGTNVSLTQIQIWVNYSRIDISNFSDIDANEFSLGIYNLTATDTNNITLLNSSPGNIYNYSGNFTSRVFDGTITRKWTRLAWNSNTSTINDTLENVALGKETAVSGAFSGSWPGSKAVDDDTDCTDVDFDTWLTPDNTAVQWITIFLNTSQTTNYTIYQLNISQANSCQGAAGADTITVINVSFSDGSKQNFTLTAPSPPQREIINLTPVITSFVNITIYKSGGGAGGDFEGFYNIEAYGQAVRNVSFQVRTDDDNSSWGGWTGPDGTANSYFTASPADISNVAANRYIQYIAYLRTTLANYTPYMSEANLSYTTFTDAFGNYNISFVAPGFNGDYNVTLNVSSQTYGLTNGTLTKLISISNLTVNVSINFNVTFATGSAPVSVYGHVNLSNGTNVINWPIEVWVNYTLISNGNFTDNNASDFNGTGTNPGVYNLTRTDGENVTLNLTSGVYNSSGTYLSRIFDAGGIVSWKNLSWGERVPYGEELPNNRYNETGNGIFGGINMTGNVLLFHLNNDSSYGESDSLVFDFSGNGNNASVNGNAHANLSDKMLGTGSYYFDGTGDFVNTSDTSTLDITGAMSVSVWVKRKSTGGSQGIVAKGGDGFYAPYDMRFNTDNRIIFAQSSDGASWGTLLLNGPVITDTNWHHFAFTSDLSTARLYADGVEVENDGTPAASLWNNAVDVMVAAEANPASPQTKGSFCNCWIDEVGIWSRSLSADEILNIYKRGVLRLGLQARTCSASDCSDEPNFIGPTNTSASNFTNATLNDLALTNLSRNRYFQYRA
ncbi:hypothetical protein HYU10_04540, partial [Candidatus Woesearchaeota archaeon]|nr:hypothetical protein [Candidatus Woesearchaeota archaeon]